MTGPWALPHRASNLPDRASPAPTRQAWTHLNSALRETLDHCGRGLAMAAARSTQVVFTNHSEQPSGKLDQTLPHGVWRNAAEPPFTFTTGETVWWESESDG